MTSSPLALRSNFDDLNLAEASLISCLTRLKAGETRWEHSFVIAGREMHVECLGNAYGFPHGPDNDMMLVLSNLFLERGKPRDNSVECSAYALLKMLGRTDSSQNYRIIHDSLTRLSGTMYKISGWLDHPGGTARRVTFRFIERVEEVAAEATSLNLKSFGAGTKLRVTLDKEVAASLSSPRVRPFDLDFMLKLPGSQSRMLFRLLDTLWYSDPQASSEGHLDFELLELGKLLRLTNLRPDSIRRTISPIHDELIASEFLKSAVLSGRGATQRVRYVLNPQRPDYPLTAEQPELVGRLKLLEIPDSQARAYIRKHTVDAARARLALAERILASTSRIRKSRGAYAWDILNDATGKYVDTAGGGGVVATVSQMKGSTTHPVEEDPQAAFDELRRFEDALPAEEQWERHRGAIKLLLGKRVGQEHWKLLEARCRAGEVSASALLREANAAMAALSMHDFVETVVVRLKDEGVPLTSAEG